MARAIIASQGQKNKDKAQVLALGRCEAMTVAGDRCKGKAKYFRATNRNTDLRVCCQHYTYSHTKAAASCLGIGMLPRITEKSTRTRVLKVVSSGRPSPKGTQYTNSSIIYSAFRFLEEKDREYLYVLHLDTKSRLTAKELISIGSLDAATAVCREIFKGAVLNSSAAIILVHNHPSGDCEPSGQDKDLTCRLKFAGQCLGIKVFDHVIIGVGEYYSFTEEMVHGRLSKEGLLGSRDRYINIFITLAVNSKRIENIGSDVLKNIANTVGRRPGSLDLVLQEIGPTFKKFMSGCGYEYTDKDLDKVAILFAREAVQKIDLQK